MDNSRIKILKDEVKEILLYNILPYWIDKMIDDKGGFYGRIDGNDNQIIGSDKGAILNARILWTFSSAFRLFKKSEYLQMATRAKRVIINSFFDNEFGGIYWSIKENGEPKDTKKQIYALGFGIYGLSEYYRATSDKEALDYAISLFESIEKYSFDKDKNGYFEALTREWNEIDDMRLSDKDVNERKTMNTHLHILEAYTNLYRVWKDKRLESQLRNLIDIFINNILDKNSSHLNLFFDEYWNIKYRLISYGHDIEASWLIDQALSVLGEKRLKDKIVPIIKDIADAASQGLTNNGGMIYENNLENGKIEREYHWWVQAETVIGYLNIYQHTDDEKYLSMAINCWEFIKNNIIDYDNGEWYWSVDESGVRNRRDDKAGFWKCPYHNGRMCMEIIERF